MSNGFTSERLYKWDVPYDPAKYAPLGKGQKGKSFTSLCSCIEVWGTSCRSEVRARYIC